MAKGYRILARRLRTPYGEVDLIAVRGRRLAFIEVKRRATRAECEAALGPRGGVLRLSRNPRYRDHDLGLDAVLVMPRRLPVHLPDALHLEARNMRGWR